MGCAAGAGVRVDHDRAAVGAAVEIAP